MKKAKDQKQIAAYWSIDKINKNGELIKKYK